MGAHEPTSVVITGASSGIGAALAERLARRGDAVVLVARRPDALAAVTGRCGASAHAIAADVTARAMVQQVVADSIARFGRIDVWVNNVGQGITRAPSALTDEDLDEIMRVNVKSALYGMQEVVPHFKARGTGHVVNISSMRRRGRSRHRECHRLAHARRLYVEGRCRARGRLLRAGGKRSRLSRGPVHTNAPGLVGSPARQSLYPR
ncbi:MAG: SDR family oxidoreductase [Vicinamibacterales bacterium]